MQRPQSNRNEQLKGQKQPFLETQLLVSPDKPKNKDAYVNWQIYSSLKRELSCVELYPFPIQPFKGNNCGLIPISPSFHSVLRKKNLSIINSIFNEHVKVILEQYNEIPKFDSHLNTCTIFVKKEPPTPERAFFLWSNHQLFCNNFLIS